MLIAAVFEFLGAVALGKPVSTTIQKYIAKPSEFYNEPEILMFG